MRKIVPAHGRDCAPVYVLRRKTPLSYLFLARPARLGGSVPFQEGPKILASGSIQSNQASLGITAQLLGEGALRTSLEAML